MDALTMDQCHTLFTEEHVAHMGVITADGPYVTPISYVFFGTQLAFRTAPGRRTEALRIDPRVSVEVSRYERDTGSWTSAIASGTARIIRDDAAKEQVVIEGLFEKYRDAYDNLLSLSGGSPPGIRFIVLIDIDEISGRTSGGFMGPRTRPGRL
jgi:nitroimidazol reductase NimA-like FMN-containing flavoprotein (pyridoxamine 5'-phosphate oxidase superfamily)